MKKILLLFAATLAVFAVNAADQYPNPGTTNSLSAAFAAVGDGEVVWLDNGTYSNSYGVDYTYIRSGKSFSVKAISGKSPVVKLEVPIAIREAASVKFVGIKFDGGSLSKYTYYIYAHDNGENTMEFEDCEFTNTSKYVISVPPSRNLTSLKIKNCNFHDNSSYGIINQGTIGDIEIVNCKFKNFSGNKVIANYDYSAAIKSLKIEDSEFANNNYEAIYGGQTTHIKELTINNCYFHDSKRSAVFIDAPSSVAGVRCDEVNISNSTFANFDNSEAHYGSIVDIRNGGSQTDLGVVKVDHCTFYNNTTYNSDHVCVRVHKSTNALVSNCIFVMPESYDRLATNLYGGNIKNCLTYNYSHSSGVNSYGHYNNGATRSNLVWGDPLFIAPSAATPDYTLQVAGTRSPALNAGENNSHLGDPRWWPKFYVTGSNNSWTFKTDEMSIFEAGHYFKVISDLTPGETLKFKITNTNWDGAVWGGTNIDNEWGDLSLSDEDGDSHNVQTTVPSDGRVVIYFDLKENKIWAKGIPTVDLVGSFTNWGEDAIRMDNQDGDVFCTTTVPLTPGSYTFRIRLNDAGSWQGNEGTMVRTNSTGWEFSAEKNCTLIVDVAGDYTFTYVYGSKRMSVTYPMEFSREVTAGNYGTVCFPHAVTASNRSGANFYSIAGKRTSDGTEGGTPTSIVLALEEGDLAAGRPYIFQATASNLTTTFTGDATATAGNYKGLIGSFTGTDVAEGNYLLSNNQVVCCGTGCSINATRAYIDMSSVPLYEAGSSAPGIREIPMAPQSGTSLQKETEMNSAVKFVENGRLLIRKGDITYDALGRIVK